MKQKTFKDAILIAVTKRERLFRYLFRLVLSLLGFLVLNDNFGYMGTISSPWLPIALGIVCTFLPLSATAFIMAVYLAIHLYALSMDICILFIILCLAMVIISKMFGGTSMIHIIYTTVLYTLSVPFLAPLYEGLFGRKREGASIIGGAVIAFYLRIVMLSATGIKNDENQNAFTLLRDSLISNTMFYLFLVTMAVMFILVYIIRRLRVRFAWFYAVVIGTASEIIMMSAGYMLTGNSSRITTLLIGSAVTLALGLFAAFFLCDVRIAHQKELDFEDDEYYYHVVCTPKIVVEDNTKKVKRITHFRHSDKILNKGSIEESLSEEAVLSEAAIDETPEKDTE